MSLSSQLARLERQRRQELDLLRSRTTALADSLITDSAPAQWIRDHPYLATASAAFLGLTIAQLPLKLRSPKRTPSAPPSPPPTENPISAAYADLLPLFLDLAHQLLQPPDATPATVTPDSSFTLSTPTFPSPLSLPPAKLP